MGKGLSQKELAEILKIDPTTLSRIERGYKGISKRVLKELVKFKLIDKAQVNLNLLCFDINSSWYLGKHYSRHYTYNDVIACFTFL